MRRRVNDRRPMSWGIGGLWVERLKNSQLVKKRILIDYILIFERSGYCTIFRLYSNRCLTRAGAAGRRKLNRQRKSLWSDFASGRQAPKWWSSAFARERR